MSALLGERDRLIMNTVPRYATPMDRALMLTASATMFEVSLGGVASPASITFSALMLGALGAITFSTEPAVPLTVANGNAVLNYADMTASIVTVTATTVIEGVTYRARQTVAKQQALDLTPPPAPTGLVATGHPATISLAWDAAPANYKNLSHTEVWRAPVNNFAQAVLAGRADGREYTDPVGPGAFRYYWIRYVSRAAIPGPYNASSGTVGASDVEVEHLLQVLTGEITESQLYADLGAKIDLIEPTRDAVADLEQAYGDTASAAASAAQAIQAAADAALKAAAADAAAGGASQYASQANQSATNANTAAGNALTSAGQSSQAASAAGGSAAAAESAASTAANAAGAAGASASAASTSKDTAASSASAAGVQAAASSQSAIEAKAARDAASGSASAALQSAGSASASSTAAGGAASQAATSAELAVGAKNTATGAAASASQSAGAAGTAETNADGSAQAAALFLQQAQAILTNPITGLVDKYAAVKVLADATANSLGLVQAKYSVQVDADGVAGGLEVIAGGGRVDFGVRASTFFLAAPLGSPIPSSLPFIVRTTETVVGGVTIPIGMYVADAFIQNASITNAKIGGDIWSSNFVAGSSGWRLYRSGDMEINNLRARGAVMGGAFTGYAWPDGEGIGYFLGSQGLLFGNPRTGRYFQIGGEGNISMPGMTVVDGKARFGGELVAVTGTFAGNLSAASGTLGTITAGYLQNAANTTYVNLSATGDQTFLYAGGGKIQLNADGSGAFARAIISEPNVVKFGKKSISVGWRNNTMPFTEYVDTGETFSDLWYEAPSATYIGNATLSGGLSESGGLSGYVETTVVVGGGLHSGAQTPVGQRIYLRVTWTPGNGPGRINPASIAWKLVKV